VTFFSYVFKLLDAHIQCGHIWHRDKLFRRQLDLLVSCTNDEHQISLQWVRSSHPVAAECRVSQTVRLKYFTFNVLGPPELRSNTLNVPVAWHAWFTADGNELKYILGAVIS
jgi:hypothetical protein